MKRLFSILVSLMMIVAVAGPAAAAFEDGHLIGVAYSTDKVMEIAFDLGAVTDLGTTAAGAVLSAAALPGDLSTFSLAFFGRDGDNVFFATTKDTAPSFNPRSIGTFFSADTSIRSFYSGGLFNPTDPNSYNGSMNNGGLVPGNYTGLNKEPTDGEAGLDALTVDNALNMYLYQVLDLGRGNGELVPGMGTDYFAHLQLTADGDITKMNPSAVPVPAAVWLLGSGLLGLIGIRRKNR